MNPRVAPSSSQIPIYRLAPQEAQIHVSKHLHPILMVSGSSQAPLSQIVQGASSSQLLAQSALQVLVGQIFQNLAQCQPNPPS